MGVIDSIKDKVGKGDDADDASSDERARRSGKRLRNPDQEPAGRSRERGRGAREGRGQSGPRLDERGEQGGRQGGAGPGRTGPEPRHPRGPGGSGPSGEEGARRGSSRPREGGPQQPSSKPSPAEGAEEGPDFADQAGLDEPAPPQPTGEDAPRGGPGDTGPRRGMLSGPDRPPAEGPQGQGGDEDVQGVRDDLHQITQQNERIIDLLRQIKNRIR